MPRPPLPAPAIERGDVDPLTVEEMRTAIEQLGAADILRLEKAAAYFGRRSGQSADDLRQEAYVRALDGRRRCPRGVGVPLFLSNVMGSIASERDRDAQHADVDQMTTVDAAAAHRLSNYQPDVLEQVCTRIDGDRLRREAIHLFNDNERAKVMFEGIVEEMEGEELRGLLDASQTEFDSLRRLVRRRLDKHFQGPKP